MHTQDIRRHFLKYFKDHGHSIIASSAVVPHDDPTLLFTNAGMNQFKDVFLGESHRDYKRATTSQKCVRVGGKHNDLENVGHTKRHLTFFEMLGNFSFGDYFKKEAIQFAWDVSTKVFGLDPARIYPTVFREDDEAFLLWQAHVPADRIYRFDEKDNFWSMGDTGPCGPCSELLYDRGPEYGTATNPHEDKTGERFLEFWNLVFMQYNRQENGELLPLPKPSVDTGAGLERVVALKMGVESVYETDILRGLIAQIENISGVKYEADDARAPAFRVIADHLRCLAFAIADGVQPSNVDRGYVLRKVLRRAVRYGRSLGFDKPFLASIFPQLQAAMGDDYKELIKAQDRICEILTLEEEAFLRTLRRGGNILNQIIDHAKSHGQRISGDEAFKLKDTYGLPIDEILLLAKDAGLTVDEERYAQLEQDARDRSRQAHKTTKQMAGENLFQEWQKVNGKTSFVGYDATTGKGSIKALVVNGNFVDEIHAGDDAMLILDHSPFYAEMGGQVGDTGHMESASAHFVVNDTQAPFKGIIGHIGTLSTGSLKIGDAIDATVNAERRQKIANNHTATHLLHWALHQVLGEHVKQAGSVVDPQRLRFDFNHHKALSSEEIRQIEDLVNKKIRENRAIQWYELPYEEVQTREDIKQFFGDKYDAKVRVIDIDYSKELCGGTHTNAVGTIGYFRISKESSIAAGVRRIEAVTGADADALAREGESHLNTISTLLKTPSPKAHERVEKLLEENKLLLNELKEAKRAGLNGTVSELLAKAESANGIRFLVEEVSASPEELRDLSESILAQMPSGILVLAAKAAEDRCQILARVSDDIVNKGIKASDLIKAIAPIIDGSGGGKPNMAQAGGKVPQKIGEALSTIRGLITNRPS